MVDRRKWKADLAESRGSRDDSPHASVTGSALRVRFDASIGSESFDTKEVAVWSDGEARPGAGVCRGERRTARMSFYRLFPLSDTNADDVNVASPGVEK